MQGIVRRKTRIVKAGGIQIGGAAAISVQSMTTTDTRDVSATVNQIKLLQAAGCDIVRVAVVDREAAAAIRTIKSMIDVPVVADIHFDYRLAVESIENGADKIRINPGNIGGKDRVEAVLKAAKA
ncbi:MAG: flavodoxin-dependent (E)-4-hydroxy-3-methylbut-2-enyl-diphosphate synthase, partial [Eubacteriales bacterium]|nr:flavodoxin-dependent (E)-4-hydroxy-3-methylbut-2-enyl-diphosphate synthase [Eubacteriales bacterium]